MGFTTIKHKECVHLFFVFL